LQQVSLELLPHDNHRLVNLCGELDQHLHQIEQYLDVKIHNRGHHFHIKGPEQSIGLAEQILTELYHLTKESEPLTPKKVHLHLQRIKSHAMTTTLAKTSNSNEIHILGKRNSIVPHSPHQQQYVNNILTNDINFGIGPAGTGKTFLAVACAVSALQKEIVTRILLVRPAVEAGERLGFLPGDFNQKLDPYFRPLYDALHEMLGFDDVLKLIDRHIIEVVPLAYMRGRTLNDAFIILDEAQNTTREQMKMFLTRIGFNSKAVVTGDITQTDLPKGSKSGLNHTIEILQNIRGISFTFFDANDVVRHPLVQGILQAYDNHEKDNEK
jgi:phosphate starvation-inducible PhoH-like protein